MRAMNLIVPMLFAIQFVGVLVALVSAILFAGPQVTFHDRNLR